MEQTPPKIELYVTRTFSEKMGDTLGFLRENWRVLLKYFTYTMLPASLVLGFLLNHFWGNLILSDSVSPRPDEVLLSIGSAVVVGLVVYAVFLAMLFALIRLYFARKTGLEGLTNNEFLPEFFACLKRAALYLLVAIVLAIAYFGVLFTLFTIAFGIHVALGVMLLPCLYSSVVVLVVPFMLSVPIYMMEDISVFNAITKSFRLGFATWRGVFALSFVTSLLSNILQTVTAIPWYILLIIRHITTASYRMDEAFVNTIGFKFMEYLACVLQCLGYMLAAVLATVALTIQYGHANDKIDGAGVDEKIEHFDEFDDF